MPRKPLIRSSCLPYHLTARSNNRDWFYLPLYEIWEIFEYYLEKISETYNFQIHSFVLMANHFHLIASTPDMNLDECMRYLLRETCREVNKRTHRINHLFGGPYKWSLISDKSYYEHAMKYVYRNPVKAGICERVEQYSYSTLQSNFNFSVTESIFDRDQTGLHRDLEWLNLQYSSVEDDCIRRALRRKEFQFSPHRRSRQLPELFQLAAK